MLMRKRFHVPILPYLKKYATRQFFAGLAPPYKLEENTLIGKQVMSLILDNRTTHLRGDNKIEMSQRLEIELSKMMAERSPSINKLIPINFFLHQLFKNELITWIKSADEYGVKPFVSSKDFLVHYRIDESEYSHDAAYKMWTRHKSIGHKQKKTPLVS